jgi:hypothetical protein
LRLQLKLAVATAVSVATFLAAASVRAQVAQVDTAHTLYLE